MALLELRDVRKIYGGEAVPTEALSGVSFTVNQGEFVAIMGPSGSGKSTLLHIMGLLDTPSSGKYFFSGKNTGYFNKDELARFRNRSFGFVFQSFHLLPRTSVLDNVKLPLVYSNVPETEWSGRVSLAVNSVGLSPRADHVPSELSGGEKQRAAIARSLVMNPEVIFADEPTGNLDSKSGEQVLQILRDLHRRGKTIILITHETYTAEYAERIIRLRDGLIESDEKVVNRRDGGLQK